jgi:hypothetical protein
MNPKPSPGRIVHYVLPTESQNCGQHRAAIITSDFEGPRQNLHVLLDQPNDVNTVCIIDGLHPPTDDLAYTARAWSAMYDPGAAPGTWHWPERV